MRPEVTEVVLHKQKAARILVQNAAKLIEQLIKIFLERASRLNCGSEDIRIVHIGTLEEVEAKVIFRIKKFEQGGVGIACFPGDLADICGIEAVPHKQLERSLKDRPL